MAKRANVAACTVSRVLNGTANVAPETRMKIEQAMKELNYIPNELARSMFKQKAGIVAMLVPDIRHPYFSSLARHIEDELYKNDCKLMLCSTGDDPEREKEYMKILRSNIVDGVIMRIADMMISFPGMILAIAIAGMLGPSLRNGVIAITAVSWTKYARLARSMVLKVKRNLYVEAAIVNGTSTFKILWKHILPNMLTIMTVTAAADMGTMMLELASLSFLGFGAVAPTPEWGLMLNEGRTYMAKAPWLMIAPGIAIVIVVIIFNMLGDSIRDILDPRQD